ncbi:hypothetical protein [Actinoplanes sp. NPDC051859]|uniref:hypothetical protein n=1 Tax=Actinoplanes sp. NPDC051859 TaxID=3363909 RepID=UPI0037A0F12A
MLARRVLPLAVAGATFAASLGSAVPASAAVQYDPDLKTGLVDAADVRKAFGWSDEVLANRANGLVFRHDFWTEDTYTVSCGGAAFGVKHQPEFGNFALTDRVVRAPRRGSSAGYGQHTRLVGFRITGPYAGISGTSVPPAVGQPCPEPRGSKITRADRVSTTSSWSLTVSSGPVQKTLRTGRI